MRKLILGKTLLESYQSIPRIISSIDRLVVESSAHSYSLTVVRDDTMQKMQAVIDLIERKKRLMRIKLAVEEGIKACTKLDAKILVRYYFDRAHSLDELRYYIMSRVEKQASNYHQSDVEKHKERLISRHNNELRLRRRL